MDIKDSYLHGTVGVVKSISVNADKLTYNLADAGNTARTVTLPLATTSENGLLSSTDKTKLDASTGINQAIPYIVGSDTDDDGVWTGEYAGITEYTNGLTIIYVPKVAGKSPTTLKIGTLAAVQCRYNGSSNITTHYPKNTPILLTYVDGFWNRADYGPWIPQVAAYCASSKSAFNKTATCSSYNLIAKSYIHMLIVYDNEASGELTMNISNKGPKPIYINGTASSSSNYKLPAGTYIVYYDGTNYYFRTDGMLPGAIERSANGIHYIDGTGTGSSQGEWLGYHSGISLYYEGLTIAYKIPVKGINTGTTLNINSLGAKAIKINTWNLTTHFGPGVVVILVYDGTDFRVADYDSNTNTQIRIYRQNTGYNADYPLIVSRTDASSIGTLDENDSSTGVYGVMWNDLNKVPTLNPSTGEIKAVKFTGSLNGPANNVANNLILKINSGTDEGTNLYTYNGSNAKTLDIKNGPGIGFTNTSGVLTIYNSGVRSISTGTVNGTISVNTNGTSANVAVKGLGSAAYTNSTAYAVRQTLVTEDLNDVTTPGFYNGGGGNTCANKPEGVGHFGMYVIHGASGAYYVQILFEGSDSKKQWRRHCDDGTWSSWTLDKLTDTTYKEFTGATSSADGTSGLVPKPTAGNQSKFLKADGTWSTPTNTTYNVVSNSANGLAPKVINTNTASVGNAYYVLASTNGLAEPSWYKLPANAFKNDDTKVTQTNTTTSASYRVLLSGNDNDTTTTTTARKSSKLLFNPYTGALTSTTFIGNLDGIYVNKLTEYSKATAIGSIATTDSLNTALGKLEYKADSAYDWIISVTTTDTDEYINKWSEIVGFLDSVKEGTDILEEFVTCKTTQTITGAKSFSGGVTLFCGLNIDGTNPITWNDGSYRQRIQNTDDVLTNTAVFTFQQSANSGSTWTNLFTIKDNGNVVANKFITSDGTSSQFVKGDGSLDSTTYLTHQSLANYVTLNTVQTITESKTFSKLVTFSATPGILVTRSSGVPYFRFGKDATTVYGAIGADANGNICVFNDVTGLGWHVVLSSNNYTTWINTTNFPGLNSIGTVTSIKVGSTSYSPSSGVVSLPAYPTSLKSPNAIKFKNTAGTEVSYDGSAAVDLTGGVNYATESYKLKPQQWLSNVNLGYEDLKLRYFTLLACPATTSTDGNCYAGQDNSYGFPVYNNANSMLWIGSYAGNYGHQLGFSSNGNIYSRYISNGLFATTVNGGSWKKIAWTSEIPTKTSQLTNDSGFLTSRGYIGTTAVQASSASQNLTGIGNLTMSGDLTLYAASGNSPAIVFHRGALKTDANVDWRIYVTSGHLKIQNALSSVNQGEWTDVLYFAGNLADKVLKSSYHIVPLTNNTLTLGTSSLKWSNVYATTFNGNLTGNATTATTLKSTTVVYAEEFSLSNANWTDTGYKVNNLATGTYAVQVTSGTDLVASGIMSVYNNLEDTTGDEIPLHVYHTPSSGNPWRPYLRTYQNNLLISSNDASATPRTVTIKVARIL